MKRFDDSTKKLIKNVAALITSALVLIAATVAWFASGSRAGVNQLNAKFENRNYSNTYYEISDPDGVLQSATVGGSNAGFTIDYGESQEPTLAGKLTSEDWTETEDFNIDSLEPGFYKSFKISVGSASYMTPTLSVFGITTASGLSAADRETVLKNIYVRAIVVQTTASTQMVNGEEQTQTTYSAVGSFCGSLFDMADSQGRISQRLANTQILGNYDVLLDIGIPGDHVTTVTVDANQNETSTIDNLRNAHDALRQIGTMVTLSSITITT